MKNSLMPFIMTSLAHFVNDGYNIIFSVLITYYLFVPGLTLPILGAVAIVYTVTSGLLSTPLSLAAQRMGQHVSFMSLGILLQGISVFLFIIPFVYHNMALVIIVAGALLLGVGQSTYHPLGAFIISQSYKNEKAASYMGLNGSFGSLGRAAFPSIIVFSIEFLGYVMGLAIIGILAIISALLIDIMLRSYKFKQSSMGKEKQKAKLEKGFLAFVIYLTIMSFLRAIFFNGTFIYIPQYFVELTKSHALMGIIMTVSLLMAVIGQPLFGHLTTKWGGKVVVAITTIFSLITFSLFLFYSKILWVSVTSFALFSLFSLTSFPVLMGYVNQKIPKEIATVSSGVVWGIGVVLGGATGIGMISIMNYYHYSLAYSFWVVMIFGVISALMIPWLEIWLNKEN